MTTNFRPIEAGLEHKNLNEESKQRIRWYVLIRDAEQFRKQSGWGLARVWGNIHQGNYATARKELDEVIDLFHGGPHDDHC